MFSISWMLSAESDYFGLNCTSIVLEGSWKMWAGASCSLKHIIHELGQIKHIFFLPKLLSMGCNRSSVCWVLFFFKISFQDWMFSLKKCLSEIQVNRLNRAMIGRNSVLHVHAGIWLSQLTDLKNQWCFKVRLSLLTSPPNSLPLVSAFSNEFFCHWKKCLRFA